MQLRDKKILISASLPPSIPQKLSGAIDQALRLLCDEFWRAGAKLVYGGDLSPDGFTAVISRHVKPTENTEAVFSHVIDGPTFIGSEYADVRRLIEGRVGLPIDTFVCVGDGLEPITLDRHRNIIVKTKYSQTILDERSFKTFQNGIPKGASGFSLARRLKAQFADACIPIGGKTGLLNQKTDQYFGEFPGVAEEALLFLSAKKPVVPLGAFGGCALEIAIALQLVEGSNQPIQKRTVGFATMMDQLALLRNHIPDAAFSPLCDAARSTDPHQMAEMARFTVSKWDDEKPRNTPGMRSIGGGK